MKTPPKDSSPQASPGPGFRRRARWVPVFSLLGCLGAAWLVVPPSTWGGGPSLAELRGRFERAPVDASLNELRDLMGTVCLWNEHLLDATLTGIAQDRPELLMASCGGWRPSHLESGVARIVTLQFRPAAAPLVDLLESVWPGASWGPAVRWRDYRAPALTVYLKPGHGWRLHEDVEGTYGGEFNDAFARVWKEWKRESPRTSRTTAFSELR